MNRFLVATLGLLGAVGLAQASVPVTHSTTGQPANILAPAVPAAVLYDQMNNDSGGAFTSQDFEAGFAQFTAQGADDFVVPAGQTWTVTGVDVAGQYFNGGGPAASFNVFFYANAGTLPGALLASLPTQAYTNGGSPVIVLSTPVVLLPGTYWVSVQARMDFAAGGQWGLEGRNVQSNNPAAWQNPGNGFGTGCTTWGVEATCIGSTPDHMFRLNGTISPVAIAKAFSPTSVTAGVSSTLTITLFDANAAAATLVADLTDTFPTGLVVATPPNAATTCIGGVGVTTGAGSVTLGTGAAIPGTGSCTVSVDVTSTTGGSYANSIAIGALQTDAGINAASADAILTVVAPPTIAKAFSPTSVLEGASSTLTITLSNANVAAATLSADLVDTFPAGLVVAATPNAATTCTGGAGVTTTSGSVTLGTGATIPAAGSCTVSVDVSSTVGTYANSIAAGALQTNAGNNAAAASATLTVTPNPPSIAKAFSPPSVLEGASSTLTITLSNANVAAATLVADLTDTFPTGLVLAATPSPATTCIGGAGVTTTSGSVTLGTGAAIPGTGSCMLSVNVSAIAGSYANSIAAGALQTDAGNNAAAASATLTVTLNPPTIAKAFSPASVATGVSSTLTITLSNANPTTAATLSAALVDTFPAGLTIAALPNAGTTCTGGTVSLTSNSVTLASGASIPAAGSCTVTVDVSSGTPGSYVNSIAAGALQTNAGSNAASAGASLTVTGTAGTFPPTENFDEVTAPALPTGWVSSGVNDWTTVTTASDTAPNAAFANDVPAVSDFSLYSPTFTPVTGQNLSFRHQYNLENTFDGAVLEISINGGSFADMIVAGGSFVTGGYNGVISSAFGSPIAGRQAWTGDSGGFVTALVDLPAAAVGQSCRLRFRTADDSSATANGAAGWWVDTISLGLSTPAAATVTPASFAFTVATNATASATLNIANAAGSDPLTFAITARGPAVSPIVLKPHARATGALSRTDQAGVQAGKLLVERPLPILSTGPARANPNAHPVPWRPLGQNTTQTFLWDDGTPEQSIGFGTGSGESGAVWINRFAVTGPLTIDSISIIWPSPTMAGGDLTGLQANLVVYYDVGATGNPANAVRLGTDTLVTIASPDSITFQNYTVSFSVPGAGDVYIGFVDQWALAGGYTPRLFPAAEDTTASQGMSYVSGASTPPTDIVTLGNNNFTGTIDSFGLPGNWTIRATGTTGGATPCTGPVVTWLTANPAGGTVAGGANTNVTVMVNPAAASLTPGRYTGELCIKTNDPAQTLIAVPVSLTVTTPCRGSGTDEIFCDGFDYPAATYTDRTTFLTHVAAGYYENPFANAVPGPSPALSYSDPASGIAYTVDSAPTANDLFNGTGVISTNSSIEHIVVTFTGTPVTAVGGNFWATDVNLAPTGTDVTLTLSNATTLTFTSTGPSDFRGFTTAAPISSITIEAPDVPAPAWPTMDNLILGTAN